MRVSARLQFITCLIVYVSCAHAIMVKFGTKEGPIEPPTPAPVLPTSQPFRAPAPVWEQRNSDIPDPNAQWRPQLFIPQPRYTHVVVNYESQTPQSLNNAQRFVSLYLPKHRPVQAKPVTEYFTPSQILSAQSLPGFGLKYFAPVYARPERKLEAQKEDFKYNAVETNDVNDHNGESAGDVQWKYEKDSSKRISRHAQQEISPFVYQWQARVQ